MISINRPLALCSTVFALTLTALVIQLYVLLANIPGNGLTPWTAIGRFLIFFTVLTNIVVAVYSGTVTFFRQSALTRLFKNPSVTTAVAVYIFIVAFVYNTVLRSLWHPAGLQRVADELLHVVVPLFFIAYWAVFSKKNGIPWWHPMIWLAYPALYLLYALLRGHNEGFYPYPFLDANNLTAGAIVLNCSGLLVLFLIVGWSFRWVGSKISARQG